jgi:tetratricopeptide (TPR) repeat protein
MLLLKYRKQVLDAVSDHEISKLWLEKARGLCELSAGEWSAALIHFEAALKLLNEKEDKDELVELNFYTAVAYYRLGREADYTNLLSKLNGVLEDDLASFIVHAST